MQSDLRRKHLSSINTNTNNTIQSINIPKGKYTIVANNGVINEGGNGEMEGGEITIDAQTALILHD